MTDSVDHNDGFTRRGRPIARLIPTAPASNILGAGRHDPNINLEVVARDDWWKPMPDGETRAWYD